VLLQNIKTFSDHASALVDLQPVTKKTVYVFGFKEQQEASAILLMFAQRGLGDYD
jgi:hypothetical protein